MRLVKVKYVYKILHTARKHFFDMLEYAGEFDFMEEYENMEFYKKNTIDKAFVTKYGEWDFMHIIGSETEPIDTSDLIEDWIDCFSAFCLINKDNFNRIYDALKLEYEVLDNYNGTTTTTVTEEGTTTNTNTHSISESNTNTETGTVTTVYTKDGLINEVTAYEGSESDEIEYKGTEKNTLTKDGSEATKHSDTVPLGQTEQFYTDTTEHKISAEGNGTLVTSTQDTDKKALRSSSDVTTYDEYTEDTTKSYTNRKDTSTHSYDDRTDGKVTSFEDYEERTEVSKGDDGLITSNVRTGNNSDTNVLSFDGRKTTTTELKHGNLGATTSQQMIQSELTLRFANSFYTLIFDDFFKQYCLA